ncbi:MAG: MraY family glycosyltransferase [Thermoguttaceae bacterium]|nr:MraY family glycosyltransferase [Thermoguttaceae bacterium]
MGFLLATLVPPMVLAWAGGWLMRWLAPRLGWLDWPGGRKIHTQPMPTSGGLAVWAAVVGLFTLGQAGLSWLKATGQLQAPAPTIAGVPIPDFAVPHLAGLWAQSGKLWTLLGAGTVLMMLGWLDDRRPLPWPLRLAVETLVAAMLVGLGWRLSLFIENPWITGLASVVWIVGLINAFNMLDNMDGLSVGVATIAAAMLAAVLLMVPNPQSQEPQFFVAGFLLVLTGALVGFLWHNRPPARLFLGDAGSYLIGFWIAMATLSATFVVLEDGRPKQHAILAPLCVLAVPIYDMITVVAIRLRAGRSPFEGDRSHLSHRLVELGMSRAQAVAVIYLLTATCGLGAMLLHQVNLSGACVVLVLVVCVLVLIGILESAGRRRRCEGR